MVDALASGSPRFADHFKQVRVSEFDNNTVKIANREFRGSFHRLSANMAFFQTRSEAAKWYRKWLANSLATDQTNLAILENRVRMNTVFFTQVREHEEE